MKRIVLVGYLTLGNLVTSLLWADTGSTSQPTPRIAVCADLGDPACQLSLGVRYMRGSGVSQDWQKAQAYMEKAADQGYTPAYTGLCAFYLKAPKPINSTDRAIGNCETAAMIGDTYSMMILGGIHGNKDSKYHDLVKSYVWYFLASRFRGTQIAQARSKLDRVIRQLTPQQKVSAEASVAMTMIQIDQNLRKHSAQASSSLPVLRPTTP